MYVQRSNMYSVTFLIQVEFIFNKVEIIKMESEECGRKFWSDFLGDSFSFKTTKFLVSFRSHYY